MTSEEWRWIMMELSDSELRAVAGIANTILLGRRRASLFERRARGKVVPRDAEEGAAPGCLGF
jgi:hypothetical protein